MELDFYFTQPLNFILLQVIKIGFKVECLEVLKQLMIQEFFELYQRLIKRVKVKHEILL
jgi:hypothetical protein